MSVNQFELKLASYLEYKGRISFGQFENKYKKSPSSLKRNISNLNSFLPPEKQYVLEGDMVFNKMTYEEMMGFINNLTMAQYSPQKAERLNLLTVYCFFSRWVNMSALYNEIQMSPTAKKNDSKALDIFLKDYGLWKKTAASKGIRIEGPEDRFRMLFCKIAASCLEVDLNNDFIARRANNPVQQMIFKGVQVYLTPFMAEVRAAVDTFTREKQCRLSYPSKKFLMLYLASVFYRSSNGFFITGFAEPKVAVRQMDFFQNPMENRFVSCVIGSLDFSAGMNENVYDHKLVEVTKGFLCIVQDKMITYIHTYDKLFDEIYNYLKKTILTNALREEFYDIKLDETHIHIRRMYTILQSSVDYVERAYDFTFKPAQIAGLALIFRKYVMLNRVANRNVKKIIIVTNSPMEMANFFYYFLCQYIDVELEAIININELHLLKNLTYDHILTFSNRIKTLLNELDFECLRLNFYTTNEEIDQLKSMGFSTAVRRILLEDFLEQVAEKTADEIRVYLLETYPNFFIH